MKTSKKLKPMKANVGKFLLSKALDPKAGKSSKSFFESIGKFPFVERRMKLSGSTGSKAKMLGAGAVGAGAIAGTNEAIKDYSELSQSEEFKKGREKGAEKSKKFKERAKEVIGETVGKITGKRMGGSAIKANEGIFANSVLKKLKDLKKEGKKDSSYSNVPIDHPDVESIRKIDEKDSGLEYNEKEKQMEARGIESDKMYKSRRKAKRFVDYIQGSTARKRTATEGSFRMGGAAIKGKGAVARDRGMGLQDENISVGKGADYIKDLIS
jgi:hypothetical protein